MLDRRLFMGAALTSGLLASASARAATAAPPPDDAIAVLVAHMLNARFENLPAFALDTTRAQLRDTVGVALAGRGESGVRELRELAATIGGKGESTVWASKLRLPSHDAARINAVMVHALEYDDTFGPGFLHPSAITLPAALAVADMVGKVSGRELLAAVTLANDIACRLSIAGQPGVDGFAIGWHNTTLIGYLSSALVAGRLMRLNRDQLVHAAGIAAHQAAGNAQSHIDGALTKRMGPGFASAAGVLAARLAAREVTGPRGVLEGRKGWFTQYHKGIYSRDLLLDGLGSEYPGAAMSFKPWPSCRGSHTSADAALQIAAVMGPRAGAITRIVIRNGPAEWGFLTTPIERKRHPATTVEAQFSVPWVVAAALTDGKVGIAHFTLEALLRDDLRAMAARIETVQDDGLAHPSGGPGAAVVEVTLQDGQTLRRHVAAAKGDPDVPMSAAEVTAKFDDCLDYAGIGPARQARLRALLNGVDRLPDVSRLTAAMA
ncbi:MmgE/PrpD family protein [Novosphingobium sp.]|uniref:MmgE/PrpD family protein n=1 Tax=Novosphingobium sp. TaxID=1874826 RepID=UPI00273327D2|nr:MmgE/PrpD family protein [Novosphingobium sp.]MDP3908649.1 MmgE/PrpD family protein [Novosphingobium sp.]